MQIGLQAKRLGAATGALVTVGASLLGVGIATAPQARADATGIRFMCDGHGSDEPVTVDVRASGPSSAVVGDPVVASGVQVTLHLSPDLVAALQELNSTVPIVGSAVSLGLSLDGPGASLDMRGIQLGIPGSGIPPAEVVAPSQPTLFGPATPNSPGVWRIEVSRLGLAISTQSRPGEAIFTTIHPCTGPRTEVAAFQVLPGPVKSPGGGTSTGTPTVTPTSGTPSSTASGTGPQPGTSGDTGGLGGSGGGTSGGTGSGSVQGDTLANTGVSHTVPMVGAGAAMVLLGAGAVVLGRRRRLAGADGVTGVEDGADA